MEGNNLHKIHSKWLSRVGASKRSPSKQKDSKASVVLPKRKSLLYAIEGRGMKMGCSFFYSGKLPDVTAQGGKMEKSKLAEKLFGRVQKIKATGHYQPDVEMLLEPFEWEEGVMRLFCKGCGGLYELSPEGAAYYAEISGCELPEKWGEGFFECAGCQSCDGPRGRVVLRSIKSLIQ